MRKLHNDPYSDLGKFSHTCDICNTPICFGYEYEHMNCENERTRRNKPPSTLLEKARGIWDRQSKEVGGRVFARDNYKCVRCGSGEKLTVDHVVPMVRGGTNDIDNLQTLCKSCNSKKCDR